MGQRQILVVGAGPVGLMLAAELHRHDVGVRIVDAQLPRPDYESRALGVHTRTLEAFERLDAALLDRFLETGVHARAANFYSGQRHLIRIPLERIGTPFPFSLLIGQAVTERFLIEHLAARAIAVERPRTLVDLGQDSDGVTAVLSSGNGVTEEVRVDYLVGADGAHSVTRRMIGQQFSGHPLTGSFVLADAEPTWLDQQRRPRDEVHTVMDEAGLLIFGGLPGADMRFVISTAQPLAPGSPVDIEAVQTLLNRFRPDVAVELHNMKWSSSFALSSRLVARMRAGRVFLAGDAAHIHSPESGQGMNAGIQDAINLAWKLALVVKGCGSPALLDSYHAERHPVVRKIVRETERIQHLIEADGRVRVALRDQLLSAASHIDAAQVALAQAFAANTYHYRGSPVVAEYAHGPFRLNHSRPRAGDRAPDADGVQTPGSPPRRLFEVWGTDPRTKVLLFPGTTASTGRRQRLADLVRHIQDDFAAFVDPRLATLTSRTQLDQEILDTTGQLHQHYGVTDETIIVVRPDGYVGMRSRPADATRLRRHLVETLGLRSGALAPENGLPDS